MLNYDGAFWKKFNNLSKSEWNFDSVQKVVTHF